MKRLNKIASFEFRVTSEANEIPAAFERFLALHVGRRVNGGVIRRRTDCGAERLHVESPPSWPAPA